MRVEVRVPKTWVVTPELSRLLADRVAAHLASLPDDEVEGVDVLVLDAAELVEQP